MKIAILAYGSIVHNLKSPYYETSLKVKSSFESTGLKIPTCFLDLSSFESEEKRRLCLLVRSEISELARLTELYHALHEFEDLEKALDNFMKREGTEDPSHVAIFKHPKHAEASTYHPDSFHKTHVDAIHQWLEETRYDYALIAQFQPKMGAKDIQELLIQDVKMQERTLHYFQRLPKSTQETHLETLKLLGLDPYQDLENNG